MKKSGAKRTSGEAINLELFRYKTYPPTGKSVWGQLATERAWVDDLTLFMPT